ncbi:hypothetical protein [Actinotignum urinale]|uniref:hypothetical protein n=1 Tax=Actinotignum urinale TaxID=190146 RepID=UPI002A820377|nr:hypothetical protein [Actinotignum urinale]
MSMLDICWKCVEERVLLGLRLVNQVEESAPHAARLVLRREEYLDAVAQELNDRPRKTLEYDKPSERILKLLA